MSKLPSPFESMGANVLAIAPRRSVVVAGNPRTRALLERAGAEVLLLEKDSRLGCNTDLASGSIAAAAAAGPDAVVVYR